MEHIAMNAGFAAHFSCVQSKQMKVSKLLYILIICTIKTEESKNFFTYTYLSCVQSKQMKVSKLLHILLMCTIKTDKSK